MRASDEVIERKNTIKIGQRGKGKERSRIAMTAWKDRSDEIP